MRRARREERHARLGAVRVRRDQPHDHPRVVALDLPTSYQLAVPGDEFSRFLPGRESVPIIVAGARNAGISMVFRVFGEWSNSSVAIEPARSPVAAVGPPAEG